MAASSSCVAYQDMLELLTCEYVVCMAVCSYDIIYRVPYSASKFAIRGMMEALYIELRQTYPGNLIHLMLVSPFIVETGEGACKYYISRFSRIPDPPTPLKCLYNT